MALSGKVPVGESNKLELLSAFIAAIPHKNPLIKTFLLTVFFWNTLKFLKPDTHITFNGVIIYISNIEHKISIIC